MSAPIVNEVISKISTTYSIPKSIDDTEGVNKEDSQTIIDYVKNGN